MDELKELIRKTVNEVTNQIALKEYGPEWSLKMEKALRDLQNSFVPPRSEDVELTDMLKLMQLVHGLNDFETFMVGENSQFPIDDAFWQRMGPQYSQFIGKYPEAPKTQRPVKEEEPDPNDEPSMMAVNTTGLP